MAAMGNSTGTGTKLNAGDARCKIVVTDMALEAGWTH